jgi:dTDP-4-amino-4,6-dideoxygalactose transaminase
VVILPCGSLTFYLIVPALNCLLFPPYPLADYEAHRVALDEALHRVLASGHYILGGEVQGFEQELAEWTGASDAVGVASGTDAIELMLRGLDIGPGAKVAVPSHTAVASVSAIRRAGATPVYADIEAETFTLCPLALEALLGSELGREVKAVLAVHLYGHPAAMEELQAVTDKHGVVLLEDGAQSHGAVYHGRKTGSMGRAAAFSFYPTKNLGAVGDGGAVTTSDADLAEKMRVLRQYGWKQRSISAVEGVNSRLDEMQAALLRVKLKGLDAQLARRRALAAIYAAELAGVDGISLPGVRAGCEHAYHLYVIRCGERRDALMQHLTRCGVPVALHYPAAVHQQPGYAGYAEESPALPETERAVREILSLPLHPYLSAEAIKEVCAAIRSFS